MSLVPRRPAASPLLLTAFILALLATPLAAGDWPRWLGPNQDGTASGDPLLASGEFGLELAWSRPLGIAYSAIAVADGRAVTFFADGEHDWLTAVDVATGEEIWRYQVGPMFPAIGGSEGGAAGMPVIDGERVFALGAAGHLFAVRLDNGEELWSLRVDEQLGGRKARFGFATTPLVAGDLLFVEVGGDEGRSLVGFDKRTGSVLWSVEDDQVGYQSPLLVTLGGREQIVAVTNTRVLGLLPDDGTVLWSHEHGIGDGGDGSATPVLLGDDRFLLPGRNSTKAFGLSENGDVFKLEELWDSTHLKRNFATPIFHDDHIYGFDGPFLTCVDSATGDRIWKSRPPGGRGLILVDGQLIVFANDGELVVAAASPDGYDEKARVAVSKSGSYTYPSFADGMILVRNTTDFGAVRVTDAAVRPAVASTAAAEHEFGRFVQLVEQSENKRLLIDDFMARQTGFPIVEDDRWVHIVYRGDVEDVAITGSMTQYQVEEPLERLAGTNLYYRSFAIKPGARWEYRLNVDFENLGPDPLNPRRLPGDQGDLSEVVTASWEAPTYLEPYSGKRPGSLDEFTLTSEILGNERKIRVYLPRDYDADDASYPLVVFNDGESWIDRGNLPNALNHLVGTAVSPIIAAFVEAPDQAIQDELGGSKSADYVRMLADELMPKLTSKYRLQPGAASHGIVGAGAGAMMAVYAAVERPEVFGKSGGCSTYLARPQGDALIDAMKDAGGKSATRFWLVWNEYELTREDWGVDFGRDSEKVAQSLKQAGFDVADRQVVDSYGWGGFRLRGGEILEQMFPM